MNLRTVFGMLLAAGLLAGGAASAESTNAGKEIFLKNKCKMCHSVKAVGIEKKSKSTKATTKNGPRRAPDLSDVGSHRDAEWLHSWLKKKIALKGKKHKKKFKGSDEDLEVLISWLLALKGDAPSTP